MSKKRSNKPLARANRHGRSAGRSSTYDEGYLLDLLEAGEASLFLVLDQVQDPHNLGACLRSANAAGVDAVIAPADRSAPLSETVRRIACGGADHTPYIQVTNLARILDRMKDSGVWIVGTTDKADSEIHEIDLTGKIALILGSEGSGMRRLTTERCDFLARIPMRGEVDCLNISVAAGVCLFEAVRQRSRQARQIG